MKVYPFVIPKKPRENLIYQIDRGERFYSRLHEHEELQLSYLINGMGKLILADGVHIYAPGDLFVFGSHMPHLFQTSRTQEEESHMLSLFFSPTSFGNHFFELKEFLRVQPFFEKAKKGFRLKDPSGKYADLFMEMRHMDAFDRFLALLKLIEELGRAKTDELGYKTYGRKTENKEERLQQIFDFVTLNFQKPMDLNEVAELVCMTPNSFCRFFKQHTAKSFFEFVIELRIAHACEMLINQPGLSISSIGEASGFHTPSHFNRKFKSLKGVSPSLYRKKGRMNL